MSLFPGKNNGATAMMIDGARCVGKSYIAEEFAKSEYKSYILIDFGKVPKAVLDLFVNDNSNLDLFFAKFAAFYSTALHIMIISYYGKPYRLSVCKKADSSSADFLII